MESLGIKSFKYKLCDSYLEGGFKLTEQISQEIPWVQDQFICLTEIWNSQRQP
jgi:hypothetical protein